MCEYEVQYRQRLEQERGQWNQYRESAEREIGELRRRLTEGQEEENLEDEMKKVGKLCFFLCVQEPWEETHWFTFLLKSKQLISQPPTAKSFVLIRRIEFLIRTSENLKAQEDAEKLRSVVMPMEQEIAALKSKLATAEERVKELEASKVSHLGGANWPQDLYFFVGFCGFL